MKRALFVIMIGLLTLGALLCGSVALIFAAQTLDEGKLVSYGDTFYVFDKEDNPVTMQNTPQVVHVDELNEYTLWAFICTEDKNFYKHKGLEYKRVAKAAANNIRAGKTKEGASTISQQLIKNTHLNHEKSMRRKVREAALAKKLEKKYTKNEILEMYLNVIYFGNGVYGLESASRYYFDKPAKDLTLRESAALAGLLRSPARYDPINNPGNSEQRTNLVLHLMHEQGRITTSGYASARSSLIKIKRTKICPSVGASYKTAAANQAKKILDIDNASDLARDGYRIYTYFDPAVQTAINEVAVAEDYKITNLSGRTADSLILSSDTHGRINALYTNNPLLPSTRRNFASALKPLVVYAPAIELGAVTPSTVIIDEPFVSGDFNPKNHDGTFRGAVSVREAVTHSYNIPAVKTLEYARLSRAVDVSKRLGLTLDDENLGLALGASAKGTSYNELLAGYCTLANGGIKVLPSYISRIENANGKTVWEHTVTGTRVLGDDTCYILTDMLKDAAKVGTAKKLSSLDFDIAAKTGTAERGGSVGGTFQHRSIEKNSPQSNSNTDAVCVSYTPENVLVVWHGNADMKAANDLPSGTTGGGVTTFIAREIQTKMKEERGKLKDVVELNKFIQPESVELINGEYYSKRFPLRDGASELKLSAPVLDGRIGESGAPVIWFTADPKNTYEIFRGDILLEVIKNFDGEYVYTDKNAPSSKTHEYYVSVDNKQSNKVKLYTANEINRNATNATKKYSGKQWFF